MAKTSSKSTGGKFPMGGKGKMFGKQAAGPASPGVTAGKSGAGGKFPAGGKGKMFGKGSAGAAKPGVTAKAGQ